MILNKSFFIIVKSLIPLTFVFCFLYIYSSVKYLKNQEINQIKSASTFIYRTIYGNFGYAKYQLDYVAKQIAKAGDNKQKINKILSSYQTNINNNFDVVTTWNMFSWIDKKNNLSVDGFAGIMKNPINMSQRDYLSKCRQNPGKIIFGNVVRGAISQRLIVPIAIGVVNNYGEYIGTIVFGIDIEKLAARLEGDLKDNNSQFLVIGGNKKTIFKSLSLDNARERLILNKISKSGSLEDNKINNFGNNLLVKIDGMAELSSSANSFYLITINDQEIFSSKINNLIIKQLLFCMLIALFLSMLFIAIYARIIKPIKLLSQYANDIANDQYGIIATEDLRFDEFRNLYKALSSIQDYIKTQNSLKQQLDTTSNHLRFILKSISHDLRNYIAGVSGLAMIISSDKEPTKQNLEEDKKLAMMIVDQSDQMIRFAQEILDIDQNGMIKSTREKQMDNCDIDKIVQELLFLGSGFIKQQGVIVNSDIVPDLPPLLCNKIRLRQILDNLITNAVKYSKKGGEVKISCQLIDSSNQNYNSDSKKSEECSVDAPITDANQNPNSNSGKQFYITITDNGIGMSKKDIEMALSGDGKNIDKSALDKPFDSHGIGLPNVTQIVDLIGAKMKIESKKNDGTIIKLWFDYITTSFRETKGNNSNWADNEEYRAILKDKNILLADDQDITRIAAKRILEKLGTKVTEVKEGLELVEFYKNSLDITGKSSFDAIITDINMDDSYDNKSKKNGDIATTEIRRIEAENSIKNSQRIPIIALSGNGKEDVEKFLAAGMDENFIKGSKPELLVKILIKYLK